jgi:hypothetical protein
VVFPGDQGVVYPLGKDARTLTGQPDEERGPISELREATMDRSATQRLLLERKARHFKMAKRSI